MQESTAKRRQKKQELLDSLKRQARMNIYDLKKMRFSVEISDNLPPNHKWRELSYQQIYDCESFWIKHSNGTILIEDGSFFTLDEFTKFVKKYRRLCGIKILGNYLDDLMIAFIEKFPNAESNCV